MYKILTLFFLLSSFNLFGQYWQASTDETSRIQVKAIEAPIESIQAKSRNNFSELPGFPLGFAANATFKNFRNVTLENILGDDRPELLVAVDDGLYAYQNDSLLWEKSISGVAIYPPSSADLDGDGDMEIVQVTGGVNPARGRVYALDHTGADLPGWPLNFDNHWMLTAPVLADVDQDGQMEILVLERVSSMNGDMHVLNLDGTSYNSNWPVTLDRVPAVTPSVGDIDNDGKLDIIVHSTRTMYAFDLDGQVKDGFPVVNPDTWFSFQSPLLADLDGDQDLEIIGATHGDVPEYYVLEHDGQYRNGWPQIVPDSTWTFNTPSVIEQDGAYRIFSSRPINADSAGMLFQWDEAANLQADFPLVKAGGLEGFISIANVDEDAEPELIFGSNLIDANGFGFIHAYNMDGSGEVAGFPIQPRGWTFMNGATVGDFNGDGQVNLLVLSYTQNFGAKPDSAFIHAYDLGIAYRPDEVLWSTYKGSNTRDGFIGKRLMTGVNPIQQKTNPFPFDLYPNPVSQQLTLASTAFSTGALEQVRLLSLQGHEVLHPSVEKEQESFVLKMDLANLQAGLYLLEVQTGEGNFLKKIVVGQQ